MKLHRLATLVILGFATPALADTINVHGTVYVDLDGDGHYSAGDTPVAGATVAFETTNFTVSAADGSYSLDVPSDGILWLRTPDGFVPGPVWRNVQTTPAVQACDLPLKPATATGPLSFVHVSDTHIGQIDGDDTGLALRHAVDAVPTPHFLIITGDVSAGAIDAQYDALDQALTGITVPFVPIAGNHDWYDGGVDYRKRLGPPSYSFDDGGVHFIVMNQPLGEPDLLAFADRDLASVPPGKKLVAFMHGPPAGNDDAAFRAGLAARGISTIITGHWHANRVMNHDGAIVDHNIEPLTMGGLDATPGGYEVLTLDAGGELVVEHHVTVEHPVLALIHPRPNTCVAPGPFEVSVAVEKGAGPLTVTASLDGAAPVTLPFRGGWSYSAAMDAGADGVHTVDLTVTGHGPVDTLKTTYCVDAAEQPAPPVSLPDWPQLQFGPDHLGATPTALGYPLTTVWAHSVGGHIHGGSPVLSGGTLFVPVNDLGDGHSGGLVAFDAISGTKLWDRRFPGESVVAAPAVDGNVVVAATSDGIVHGVDATSGAVLWETNIGTAIPGISDSAASLYGAPAIFDHLAYVTDVSNVAAIQTATGQIVWQHNPANNSTLGQAFASPGVLDGQMVLVTGGGYQGTISDDIYTGAQAWRSDDPVGPIAATPSLYQGFAYGTATDSTVYAQDLATGETTWTHKLDSAGFDYAYWFMATPALAGNLLIAPSQKDGLYAIDVSDGSLAWSFKGDLSVIHPTHYQAKAQGFAASPVVTGDTVWAGGADGILRALDLKTGDLLWQEDLGAPIMSGAVPAGSMLFVGTWDGTIRALQTYVPSPEHVLPVPDDHTGCALGTASAHGGLAAAPLLLLGLLASLSRRRRSRR